MTEPTQAAQDYENAPLPVQYAPFNTRIMATAVDVLLIMIVAMPVINTIAAHLWTPLTPNDFAPLAREYEHSRNMGTFLHGFVQIAQDRRLVQQAFFENLMQFLFVAAYMLPFWFRYSSTPGKMLMRIEIQDAATRAPMTRKQAVIRFLGYLVSFIPATFGFLYILFNKKRRGFHDLIAGTIVVVKPKKSNKDNSVNTPPATDKL
ncbi:MAG TPA: RDD family protein [Rickettsiales bacterium]|nr:RDD family protein [Rickettsiales bacterium]